MTHNKLLSIFQLVPLATVASLMAITGQGNAWVILGLTVLAISPIAALMEKENMK